MFSLGAPRCCTGLFATTILSTTQQCNAVTIRNNVTVATLCCAKNRRCESSRAT